MQFLTALGQQRKNPLSLKTFRVVLLLALWNNETNVENYESRGGTRNKIIAPVDPFWTKCCVVVVAEEGFLLKSE